MNADLTPNSGKTTIYIHETENGVCPVFAIRISALIGGGIKLRQKAEGRRE
jgi:hypothetical protein